MRKSFIFYYALILLLGSFFILSPAMASWAYQFVVWDGDVYIITEENVEKIGKEIGHVTKYSDREGTYSGNFSNTFPKGTKYYEIVEVDPEEAIAVESEVGIYVKANSDGEYAGSKKNNWNTTYVFVGGGVLLVLFIVIAITYGLGMKGKTNRG
ncbi:hypothetical protein MKY09_17600 [Psychrobacillus sp. FSL K6-4046]|uniref:hypothetical protein n=1 Tax=Psychrobacillus sp. FSL K6-4046 TaxID=2921550 RepID=UPI003159E1D6